MTITLTWTGADGVAWPLNGSAGILVTKGAVGLDVAPVTNITENRVAFDGLALTRRARRGRTIGLPLYITHATRALTVLEQFAASIQGPGTLQYSDGTNTRYLRDVIYDGGLGGNLVDGMRRWRRCTLALLALDPWWYGPEQSEPLPFDIATLFDAPTAFDAPIAFDGGTTISIANGGDTDAYPIATVTGPATDLTLGIAGGLTWQIAAALGASDTIVVDARPDSRGPRLNGGSVDWSLLTAASRPWTLPGPSASVVVNASGTTGATTGTIAWSPRYLTP